MTSMILNVEPGGYCPCVTRFNNVPVVLSCARYVSQSVRIVSGSKSGFETMARTAPVFGSEAMIAPA